MVDLSSYFSVSMDPLGRLLTALAIGLMIGFEREIAQEKLTNVKFAGLRTFGLSGLIGGVAAYLGSNSVGASGVTTLAFADNGYFIFGVALLAIMVLLGIAYFRSTGMQPHLGFTTEISLILTFLMGGMAFFNPGAAIILAVVATIILAFKRQLHEFTHRIPKEEFYDSLLFALIAIVILPILPNQYYGLPYAGMEQLFNPQQVWLFVVFISASDPKVARIIFIPVGVTLLVFAGSTLLNYANAAPVAIATLIGSYLLYKGLALDSLVETFIYNLRKSFQEAKLTFVTYLISLILIVMAFVRGMLDVLDQVVTESSPGVVNLVAVFFNSAIWWFVIALLAVVVGWIIDAYTEDSESLHKYMATPFFLIAVGLLVWGGTRYILDMQNSMPEALKSLVFAILGAVVVSYLGVTFAKYVRTLTEYRVVEIIDF